MGLDRDFLSMLEGTVEWHPLSGEDLFGNETYETPQTIAAFIGDLKVELGAADNQNTQSPQTVYTCEVMTDSVGVRPRDKFVFDGREMYVTSVSTGRDEFGQELYHQVQTTNIRRG